MKKLTEEIIEGRRLNKKDNLEILLTANLDELCMGANKIRKKLCGEKIDLCTIINGLSGDCSENCKFCAQSAHHNTKISKYDFLDPDIILNDCRNNEANGIHRYSIVTAGKYLSDSDFSKAIDAYEKIHKECAIDLCASHGFLCLKELMRLKNAGVTMYHTNIETSKNYFPNICTTHSYEDKVNQIKLAQKAGFKVCSGGIIGMGETFEDRIDMAISLYELNIVSIPINILMPIKGTPFENSEAISHEDILRTIAIFRYLNPTSYIRIAAGRTYFSDGGTKIFQSGANATITGNMLTTVGNNILQDKIMLSKLGFDIQK